MILAARYARENKIPYFGICLGMQIAVIEAARSLCGMADANSREFAPDNPHCVIDLMADQKGKLPKGGTMRLGAYPCTPAARHPAGCHLRLPSRCRSVTATATR